MLVLFQIICCMGWEDEVSEGEYLLKGNSTDCEPLIQYVVLVTSKSEVAKVKTSMDHLEMNSQTQTAQLDWITNLKSFWPVSIDVIIRRFWSFELQLSTSLWVACEYLVASDGVRSEFSSLQDLKRLLSLVFLD